MPGNLWAGSLASPPPQTGTFMLFATTFRSDLDPSRELQ